MNYSTSRLNQYTQRTVPGYAALRGEAATNATVTVNERPVWRINQSIGGSAAPTSARSGGNLGGEAAQTSPQSGAYDADGYMTSDGRFRYFWNGENRLVMASNAEVVVTYAYDHRGRMVTKTLCASAPLRLIKTTTYLWDDWNIIREIVHEGDSVAVTDNIWGLDIDGTLQGAGGVGGLLAVVRDDGVFLPTYDANGNVSEYVSTNGSIVAHYDYSPFGEPLVAAGELASTFTHQFSTKPYCAVTGFSEYQMRKYRPEIGRWMSRDPIGEETEVEVSRYCFIQNFSVNTTDYLGLWGCIPTQPRQSLPQKPAKKCCGDTEYDPKTECCLEEEDDGADEMVPGTEVGSTATTQNATDGEASKPKKKFAVYNKAEIGTKVYRWRWSGTFRGKHNVVHHWITWPEGGSADSNGNDDSIVHVPAFRAYPILTDGVTRKEIKLSPCQYEIPVFVSCVERKAREHDGRPFGMCHKFVDEVLGSCLREAMR